MQDDADQHLGTEPHQGSRGPLAHVVLYQPEIPQNTGNIGRTCVAVGAHLWIVHPSGFRLDEKRIRRSGLDYWQHLQLSEAADWDDLQRRLPARRQWIFSRFAKRPFWSAPLRRGDALVFGSESSGLPASLLDPEDPQAVCLPTGPEVRSLNLATTVGIALYELLRQVESA